MEKKEYRELLNIKMSLLTNYKTNYILAHSLNLHTPNKLMIDPTDQLSSPGWNKKYDI